MVPDFGRRLKNSKIILQSAKDVDAHYVELKCRVTRKFIMQRRSMSSFTTTLKYYYYGYSQSAANIV